MSFLEGVHQISGIAHYGGEMIFFFGGEGRIPKEKCRSNF